MSKKTTKPKTKSRAIKPLQKIQWIRWVDHTSGSSRWTKLEEIDRECLVCESAGFLLHEDDKILSLGLNGDSQGNYGIVMNIVKSCIVKRKTMK